MKKIFLPLMLLLCTTQLFASLRQTKYRWRNDNGTETTATWKAAENTAISIADTSALRLRIEMDNDNTVAEPSPIQDQLQYSSDNGTTWISMTNSPGQAFFYQSSTNVTNGSATTNQMGSSTFGTFVAGHIISQVPGASVMNLNDAERTELEWVIRPTYAAQPNTTYIFQVTGQEDLPLSFPTINTGCIGVYVLTKKDSARCGPGVVTLGATSTSNAVVQWYDALSGGNLVGTGNAFTTPPLSTTKVYYVSAKMGTSCESGRMAVTATIHPIPNINLGNDITVCANSPVVLNATGPNWTYLWDNGMTTATRTVTAAGSYFVTVTGTGNCKNTDTIKVNYNPRPVVDLGEDTLICPGVIVTLDAGNPGDTYLWDDGSTEQTRDVSLAGHYSVTVTNDFNCTGVGSKNVTVKDMPLGEINAIHGDTATYTFNVLNALYAVDYAWDFGDGSPVVNGFMQTHTYQQNGIYIVKLAMMGDCDTNSYRERTVDVYDARGGATGIADPSLKGAISLYPNPAGEVIYLALGRGLQVGDIDICNVLGQQVRHIKAPAAAATSMEIPVGALPAGIYTLRIATDKGFVAEKFEVRR